MSGPAESIVFCEGFYDRAFGSGWLRHLGCRDARPRRADGSHGAAAVVRAMLA